MNKQDMVIIVADDYPVSDIRDLIRWLRDEYSYDDLKTSLTKVALVNQLAGVTKEDLVEALDEVLPGWEEEESEEDEDDSDDDGDEEEEEEEEGEPEEE